MPTPPRREQRKTVTILVCDLVHSTGLADRDPEAFRRVQALYFERMRAIVERHGGVVEKFIGDEVMAVFGVPASHEDDALRAVRAADEMQAGLRTLDDELAGSLGVPLRARIGINTGEVLAGDPRAGHAFVAGEPVVVAKRLEQAAGPGEILLGESTYPLVRHAVAAGALEEVRAKGRREAIGARRLEAVHPSAPAVARRLDAPMVGRDEELALLRESFERAVDESCCRLVAVVGPAGIGKSRLAGELFRSLGDRAAVAVGRCPSYGEGITFWPLAELLRALGGEQSLRDALAGDEAGETILAALRGVTGGAESRSLDETFWAVRRTLETFAHRRPLVVCIEDLHWAEAAILDLVEYVVAWSRGAPILVVAVARPEIAEQRPQWLTPRASWDVLSLEPLPDAAAESLLRSASGDAVLPSDTVERVLAAAEGNPLFVEQMSAMLSDAGEVAVPPSIHALLAERLDRLSADEREVIEHASVVGREFGVAAVGALFPGERRGLVVPQLFSLVRKGLVRPDPSPSALEDRFVFRHALVRETAYDGMAKELRAELHERFASWLERHERARELEELRGYHLERAQACRLEVGVADEHTNELARQSSRLLASAGSRALGRNDVHAARNLLERSIALLPPDEPAAGRRLDLSEALFLSGDLAAAARTARETAARAAEAGDEVGELRARLLLARISSQAPGDDAADAGEPSAALLSLAEAAKPVFARAGDELALAEAWFATAWAQLIRCRFAAMLDAVLQALEHARRAGSARWEGELPAWLGTAMFYGPTPVEEALGWYEEQEAGHPIALTQQAMLESMRGNVDRARTLAGSADAAALDFGQQLWLAAGGMARWQIEMLAGDASAAEAAARRSCELLASLGDAGYRGTALSELAASLYALDRLDEAEACTRDAEALTPDDDVAGQMLWRQARARILARRGEHVEAERLAGEAVSLAEDTDMLNFHANALADSAEVHALGGRADEARARLRQALGLYEQKGNVVAASSARRALQGTLLRSPARAT